MTKEEIKQKTSLCFLLNPNIPEEEKNYVIERVMATKATIVPKSALCNIITYILKQIAELKEKISVLLSCKNCSENKSGWICVKEHENKCLAQKIEFIKELEKEKCELLGVIQGKDEVIQELKKVNEWHFVSKEGFPNKDDIYLIIRSDGLHLGDYCCGGDGDIDCQSWCDYPSEEEIQDDSVIAWKEITLPKE